MDWSWKSNWYDTVCPAVSGDPSPTCSNRAAMAVPLTEPSRNVDFCMFSIPKLWVLNPLLWRLKKLGLTHHHGYAAALGAAFGATLGAAFGACLGFALAFLAAPPPPPGLFLASFSFGILVLEQARGCKGKLLGCLSIWYRKKLSFQLSKVIEAHGLHQPQFTGWPKTTSIIPRIQTKVVTRPKLLPGSIQCISKFFFATSSGKGLE